MTRPQWIIKKDWLHERVRAVGRCINEAHGGGELTVVPVLTGALIFSGDLMHWIEDVSVRVQLAQAASYEREVPGDLKVDLSQVDRRHVTGKNVLIVDDILDTGRTMHELAGRIGSMNPASLRIAVLLRKRARHDPDCPVEPDYVGFEIPDLFVVGYGLDVDGLHRHWSYIGVWGQHLERNEHEQIVSDIQRQLGQPPQTALA